MSATTERVNSAFKSELYHDKMTAWACVNAILGYLGLPTALYGEWRDATEGYGNQIEPVNMAKRIILRRQDG